MRQGFKDVGYLFVPHVLTFRPAMISRRVWREQVRVLAREIGNASQSGVRRWFQTHYPLLMALIPRYRRREFAQGVIERATEPGGDSNETEG